MKEKIALFLLLASTLMASLCVLGQAAPKAETYGYVDKAQYLSGEEGKLKIWIVNEGDDDLILQNITITYPWNSYLPWEGNDSLKKIGAVILIEGNLTYEFDFTVPSDGRALSYGAITVDVVTDKDDDTAKIPISIANPPVSFNLEDMDNLITLITVQIVVAIIAALIIAAAVFLAGRRPTTVT